MDKIKVFTTFSGYDSQCLALKYAGIPFELVGWSEIDKYAITAHDALFPEYADRNYGDVTAIDWNTVPDFDLLTWSSPVQITDCQMQISRLWKSVAKFLGDDTGERVVANDTVLEEFMKVCFSTDSYGRACDEDSILVKMPIALYNSQCVANPVFAKLSTFGGYEEVVK